VSELGVGTAVAGYRIEGVVGQGSSGTVYSALELSLQRRVALKILRPELASDDRFRQRFLRESRLAASLEHPNIIPIYAAGEEEGSIYLAMRFVEGRDLGRLIADEGALEPERAVELLTQVADALDAAHRSGLVHRDVKPGNVLVDATDHAFLCDFGLAKHAVTVDSVTRDTPFAGTIDYVAPEQIHGDEIDARTDVYSLGCLFFECVSGAPPFRRQTDVAVVLAHLHEDPPSIRELMPELPEALDDAVRRALAKAPEERFESAGELAEAARSALGDVGADARPAARTPQLRTFLITDVRGYTRYTQEHGDEAGAELATTFAGIVRDVVSRRDGRLLELRGDEALVVFESARKALQAATELQQQVTEAELQRAIGIGLDAGEAVAVGRGYRGAALNTAARLCSRARGGEILASEGVVHLAGKAEGVAYGLRRQERLKGYDRPVTAVEIHPVAQEPGRQLVRRIRARLNATSPRTRVAAAALAFGAIASVVALAVLTGEGGRTLPPNSVGALDIDSGDVSTVLGRGSGIEGLIAAEDGFWGIEAGGSVLQHIDARSRSLGPQLPLPASPNWFAPRVAFGSIWATDPSEDAALWRFDAQYRRLSNTIKLPPGRQASGPQNAQGVDVTSEAVWVAYGYPKRLARVDPESGDVRSWPVPGGGAFYDALVAADDEMVWVVDRTGRNLVRVDPKDGTKLATGRLHEGEVTDARVYGGYLWVAMRGDGGVWKIDETGAAVGKVPTGEVPWSLATGEGALWVANADGGTVTRIDPDDDSTRQFESGHRPVGVGVADGRVWVTVSLSPAEARARLSGTKVVRVAVAGEPFFYSDPAIFGGAAPFVLNHATGLRLMDYRTSPSGDARVVPEAAVAPPRVLDGGRIYVFRVREGFRFSPPSNEPVTAATFRYSIERMMSPKLSNTYCRDGLASDIAGQEAYSAGKAKHISGIVASGDELRISLERPSSTLAARLAMPCFTAVPIGTPIAPDGLQEPIPSAGPYYVDSHLLESQTVIRKNPNYPADRPQRVDGVVFTSVASPQRAGELVAAGDADYAYDEGTPPSPEFAPHGRYERAFGAGQAGKPHYFRVPASLTRFVLLNTLDGPFANVRYRRAAALAIDRGAIANLVEGTPRGLLLPPGIPGYTARDPRAPRARLDRARALVGKGRPSIVLAAEAANPVNEGVTRQIQKDLERGGFEVTVRLDADPFELAKRPRPRVDALFTGWSTDYPDPHGFFTAILDPQEGAGFFPLWFQDARWLAEIRGAARLRGDARVRAYRRLDRELTSGPIPMIPLAVDNSPPQLFSARVTCQTFLPMFFSLADPTSLCLE
jgi:ABC-type transport system substrate-binding protein/class 3 adenylate cyclase/streptogramin lyase/tRNA A-37 threonylcarbamoyl transferase component Bud32